MEQQPGPASPWNEPRQLALIWREDATPFDTLRPQEQAPVIACLARMLLEALGVVREEAGDDVA